MRVAATLTAEHRQNLRTIFDAALKAVNGRRCVREFLRNISFSGEVYLVVIGKAAGAMAFGALDILGDRIRHAMVITRYGYAGSDLEHQRSWTIIESGHPWPDQNSLFAGEKLLAFLEHVPADAQLLFLVSGGASSLVEVLPHGLTLADLERANHWLLGSGLAIGEVNRVRKQLSTIKAGRLASYVAGRRVLNLLLSDVAGDRPSLIGSGLLVPDAGDKLAMLPDILPLWLAESLRHAPAIPDPDEPAFAGIETHVVAGGPDCRRAAVLEAQRLGYPTTEHRDCLSGDTAEQAGRLVSMVRSGVPGAHVWSGETTVKLPESPGRGGRNQHLALEIARRIAGRHDLLFLTGATDGCDGTGNDAGALVDGSTVARGVARNLDANVCLAMADSGTFLDASGDLFATGPTGTNVADLAIGLKVAGQ